MLTVATATRAALPGGLEMSPLRIDLTPEVPAQRLTLRNGGDRPVAVQLRAFEWQQDGQGDVYSRTDRLSVTPAIVEIAPGATQLFRVAPRAAADVPEQRYRVVVDELPAPEATPVAGMATRLRITVPVFVAAPAARDSRLRWTLSAAGLRVANLGDRSARLYPGSIVNAAGQTVAIMAAPPRYLLGGSALPVMLDRVPSCAAGELTLVRANADGSSDAPQPILCG
ncbi:fimbria/pilus periplasmic chaperone [Sphingomonas sp. SFZ2018-12]|uniref:fimbrial biogenesis chaperone n=1 Tax=Sphingomonas sp. SFZ2018-12 TaxID=2683197 RepID=UPI001F0E68F8|nr:fimbria/pilus periplasmic chaperone [Sphingomonas sp. SFZ2018-12]MCH4893078.1 fimbria/pilus periplasmic chaperone [Sphingomonas sp. SFZ2018-12]